MIAALAASIVPFVKEYGLPHGWRPRPSSIWWLARANAPLAGADAIEWATRNVDRFILALLFSPAVVGIYYMAQQVASVPQRLKSSFDPILGPVVTKALAENDRAAVAKQVRQVGFWVTSAQAALAVMFSLPAEGVMGLIGKEFVIGAGALCILLVAEVLASTGAVCETGLVYIARHKQSGDLGMRAAAADRAELRVRLRRAGPGLAPAGPGRRAGPGARPVADHRIGSEGRPSLSPDRRVGRLDPAELLRRDRDRQPGRGRSPACPSNMNGPSSASACRRSWSPICS